MSDSTIERVVSEAALAKRHQTRINERASKADIPTLVDLVEKLAPSGEGGMPSGIDLMDELSGTFGYSTQLPDGTYEPVTVTFGPNEAVKFREVVRDIYELMHVGVIPWMQNYKSPIALDEDGTPYLTIGD